MQITVRGTLEGTRDTGLCADMAVLATDERRSCSMTGRAAHMHGVVCEPQAGLRPRVVVE